MNDVQTSLESQQAIHQLIARQLPLDGTLGAVTTWINKMVPEAMVPVMRLDPELDNDGLFRGGDPGS